MENIKVLTNECLAVKPKLNNISKLLQLLTQSSPEKQRIFCCRQLIKIFQTLDKQGILSTNIGEFIKTKISSFLQLIVILSERSQRYWQFIDNMANIGQSKDLLEYSKNIQNFWERINKGKTAVWLLTQVAKKSYNQKLECLLGLPSHIDFEEVIQQNQKSSKREAEQKETISNLQIEAQFKKLYQSILFSVLKDPLLTPETHQQLIRAFPDKIFPKISSPLNLSEHILQKFQQTPSLELKVDLLSSLFILIGKYGLQLSDFYSELYNLLVFKSSTNESVFEISNSKRVFKMLQNSLRSSKVPFNTIVKFLKLLLNESLFNNSQFVCWVLALSFNLFKKHQLLSNCLNPSSELYVPEFKILQSHFLSQVKGLASKLQKDLKKQDFLDISEFTAINLQKVLAHQIQNLPTIKIQIPKNLQNLLL